MTTLLSIESEKPSHADGPGGLENLVVVQCGTFTFVRQLRKLTELS